MTKIVNENQLQEIANILQTMVGRAERYSSINEIDLIADSDLRTCVAMIVRIAEDHAFFDAKKNDELLEKINEKLTELTGLIKSLKPQIVSRLSMIAEAHSITAFGQLREKEVIIAELENWQEILCEVTDEVSDAKLKLPEPKTRPVNWRSRYIARYVANFYRAELNMWPINQNGNPKKQYILAVKRICTVLQFDFAAAKYACAEVLNLFTKGEDLEPPIL